MIPIILLSAFGFILTCADQLTSIDIDNLPSEAALNEDERIWRQTAIQKLWEERKTMSHTPLSKYSPPGFPNVDIFFKNETATPTRTLKHRFSWALFMWAISEGKVRSNSTVYDSTSGNTGASEAYMCSLVGLPFVAVVAKELEEAKIHQITSNGGKILKVDVSLRNFRAKDEARKTGGYFINQFGNADKAEEFHESGNYYYESTNVFHEILNQLKEDEKQIKKIPDYFVHSAGTGGTISSVGRYVTRYGIPTKVVLADSQYSLFYDYVIHNKFTNESGNKLWVSPGVAGIGYGYDVKPVLFGETTSLVRNVINEAMKVPDVATTAAMKVLRRMGYNAGASTALNFLVSLSKAYENRDNVDGRLTIATIMCDPGDYYESTYFNATWTREVFRERGGNVAIACWEKVIEKSIETGSNYLIDGLNSCTKPHRALRRRF